MNKGLENCQGFKFKNIGKNDNKITECKVQWKNL